MLQLNELYLKSKTKPQFKVILWLHAVSFKAFLSTINTVEKSPWAGRSQPALTHADIIKFT